MLKLTKEEKFVTKLIILVLIGLLFVFYGHWLENKVRQETIESAELISVDDDGYSISFNGETHWYTWD
jgi:hypothetical protein